MGNGDKVARDAQIVMIASINEETFELVGPKFGVEVHPFGRLAKAIGENGSGAIKNKKGVVLSHGSSSQKVRESANEAVGSCIRKRCFGGGLAGVPTLRSGDPRALRLA